MYHTALVADAQAFEGLRLVRPKVLVSLGKGPFHRWLKAWWKQYKGSAPSGPPKPDLALLAPEAVKLFRAGAKIKSIVITSPTLKTRRGIGVGSTLAEVEQAYGKCKLIMNPPEWGQDECMVENAFLPARIFFETCAKARQGGRVTIIKQW